MAKGPLRCVMWSGRAGLRVESPRREQAGSVSSRVEGEVRLRVARDDAVKTSPRCGRRRLRADRRMSGGRLSQDVEPERRPAFQPWRREADSARSGRRRRAARDGLPRRESGALAALEVARGERAVRVVFDGARDRLRQLDQRARQLTVDRLGALGRPSAGDVEHQRPVDAAVLDRAEADQVGEDRQQRPVGCSR